MGNNLAGKRLTLVLVSGGGSSKITLTSVGSPCGKNKANRCQRNRTIIGIFPFQSRNSLFEAFFFFFFGVVDGCLSSSASDAFHEGCDLEGKA